MIDLPMKTSGTYSAQTISSINSIHQDNPVSFNSILQINKNNANSHSNINTTNTHQASVNQVAAHSISFQPVPTLMNRIQKGQKVPLFSGIPSSFINISLGWNVKNNNCDVDLSAFLLKKDGKVLGDSWFVFYGQTSSPDKSVHFSVCNNTDREKISIDLEALNPDISKIVFVLTINDALIHHLNFEMVKDAYIRVSDSNGVELVSFIMDDYYSNVISMMIGEIYLHNGCWKFNAIGNGVAKDLAGLCDLYGVQVN